MSRAVIILLTIAAMVSCTKSGTLEIYDSSVEARFEAQPTTRTVGDVWEMGDDIGVSMFTSGDVTSPLRENVNYRSTDAASRSPFEVVDESQKIYYPDSGSVDFYSYYPYQSDMQGGIYSIDVAEQSDLGAIDLLRASCNAVSATTDAQTLLFTHQLSRIQLTIRATGGISLDDLSVTMVGANTVSAFDVVGGKFTAQPSQPKVITLNTSASNRDSATATAILIPEQLDEVRLLFHHSTGSAALTLSDVEFKASTSHNYTINLGKEYLNVGSITINPWLADSDGAEDLPSVEYQPGSQKNPLQISTADQLRQVGSGAVADGAVWSGDKYYTLACDIDLGGDDTHQWSPIGYSDEAPFRGVLDGGGHTVSGLYINNNNSNQALLYGLDGGTIKDLTIEGEISTLDGECAAGFVAQMQSGTISNCVNAVDVTTGERGGGIASVVSGGVIDRCINRGGVSSGMAGGIASTCYTSTLSTMITNCYNEGTISGSSRVGGIAAYANTNSNLNIYIEIANCYNRGELFAEQEGVGGIISNAYMTKITNCYNVGSMTQGESEGGYIGNIAAQYLSSGAFASYIYECYYNSDLYPNEESRDGVSALTTSAMQSPNFVEQLNATATLIGAQSWRVGEEEYLYPTLDM